MTVHKALLLIWLLTSVLVRCAMAGEEGVLGQPPTSVSNLRQPSGESIAAGDTAVQPASYVARQSRPVEATGIDDTTSPLGSSSPASQYPARSQRGSGTARKTPSKIVASPAQRDSGLRQAQYIPQQPLPNEPLGFSGAKAQSAGLMGAVQSPMGNRAGSGFGGSGVVGASYYMAEHPNPDEPLGFSGALYQPGSPVDPSIDPGIFEETIEDEGFDPLDPDAPAPAVSSGDWIRTGRWYTQQSAVYVTRSVNVKNSAKLATDFSSSLNPHDRVFLQIPLSMGYQPGLRSTIGRFLGRDNRNRDHMAEFTFLGLTHWQAGESLTARIPGAIFSDIDPTLTVPAYNASSFQGFDQTSNFNSFEFNYRIERRPTRDRLIYSRDSCWVRQATPTPLPSLFGGLRVISINESLNYFANSPAPVAANGSYNILTHNNMVGLQAGTDWYYERTEWRLGARVKGGGLVNWSNQSSKVRILDSNGAPLLSNRDEYADNHTLSFVGELSFLGNYQIRPNFGFRASYDLMWVTNLALGQNQITFSPSDPVQISNQHSLFYQGLSAGFEWTR